MRSRQAVFTATTLSIILSACGGGSAVSEPDQVASNPDQQTAVSNNGQTNVPTQPVNSEQAVVVVPTPTATAPVKPVTTSTPSTIIPSPVAQEQTQSTTTEPVEPNQPVVSETTTEVVNEVLAEPDVTPTDPVFGAATLSTASISGNNVVLNWNQSNDVPEGGYDIIIDGADTDEQYRTVANNTSIPGLDLSVQHCFVIQARYTQTMPWQYFSSNSQCTEAQQPDNQAPVISGTPPSSVDVDGTYSFTPQATDADNDSLAFTITNLPTWAQFNAQTGRLSGTPTADDVGDYDNITISVSDGTDGVALAAFSISVNPIAAPLVTGSISLSWVAPSTRTDGSALNLADIKGYCIYIGTTRDNLRMVVDINESERTSYVLDNLDLGDYYVAVTVYDQQDAMSGYSNVVLKTVVN